MPNGYDKNWIRLCVTIDGFFTRHGRWPNRVRIPAACATNLRDSLFKPATFHRLLDRVDVVVDESGFFAEDDTGARFDYDSCFRMPGGPTPSAATWLGVHPDRSPHGYAADYDGPRPAPDARYDLTLGGRSLRWLTPAECVREVVRHFIFDRGMSPQETEDWARRPLWRRLPGRASLEEEVVRASALGERDVTAADVILRDADTFVLTSDARDQGFPGVLYALEAILAHGAITWKPSALALRAAGDEEHAPVIAEPFQAASNADAPTSHAGPTFEQLLSIPLTALGLSVRSVNCLRNARVETLGALASLTTDQLMAIKHFGKTCLREVAAVLAANGLEFGLQTVWREGRLAVIGRGVPPAVLFPDLPSVTPAIWANEAEPELEPELVGTALEPHVAARVLELDGSSPASATLTSSMTRAVAELVAETNMSRDALLAHLGRMITALSSAEHAHSCGPTQELESVTASLKERDRRAAAMYFGFDGEGGVTLEKVGESLGVTRERARQLVSRFEQWTTSVRPPLPVSGAIASALAGLSGPVTLEQWRVQLPPEIRPEKSQELVVLRLMEDWGWLPASSWKEHGSTWLVHAGQSDGAALTELSDRLERAARSWREWGVIHARDLSESTGIDLEMVRRSLEADDRWVAAGAEWLVRRGSGGGVVGLRVRSMLVALGELSIASIRHGLLRFARRPRPGKPPYRVPPPDVLRILFEQMGLAPGKSQGTVRSVRPEGRHAPSPTDAALLAAFTHGRAAVTHHELAEVVQAHGLSAASARVAASYSPLIRRVAPGVYALLGRNPLVEEIADAVKRCQQQAAPMMKSHRVTSEGQIEITYHADRIGLSSPFIPNGLVPVGEWQCVGADGTRRAVQVRESYVTGLLATAKAVLQADTTELIVAFDPAVRLVKCSGRIA